MKQRRKDLITMKQIVTAAVTLALTGVLSGCAVAGAWFSGQGATNADLVVYNDSTAILGSITVTSETESQGVSLADGHPLERGESYGFDLEDLGRVTVELWDLEGNPAGRCQVDLDGRRVYVTLGEHGRMSAGTAEPWRN